MNWCKDCTYFVKDGALCSNPTGIIYDYVYGQNTLQPCAKLRKVTTTVEPVCGPDGVWFIAKDAPVEESKP